MQPRLERPTTSILSEWGDPDTRLDEASILDAYRRWAGIYDAIFGAISSSGRLMAVQAANRLAGTEILEVGVGTGLALPYYQRSKRITGIDLSSDMLRRARQRVRNERLCNVQALTEMNAEAMTFDDNSFDIAVGMFVASVVSDPRSLLLEMLRVVRPGGSLLFVNHFAAASGTRAWIERLLASASKRLGWHPHFVMERMFTSEEVELLQLEPVGPFGIFTLVSLCREK